MPVQPHGPKRVRFDLDKNETHLVPYEPRKGPKPEGAPAPSQPRISSPARGLRPPGATAARPLEQQSVVWPPLGEAAPPPRQAPVVPRHHFLDTGFGPNRKDLLKIQGIVRKHERAVRQAEADLQAFPGPDATKALKDANRKLGAARYQEKTFLEANADFFRNPDAFRP